MTSYLPLLLGLCMISPAKSQTTCDGESPQPSSGGRLYLRVYDSANVPRTTLEDAIEVAQHILSKAGVPTCWDRGAMDPAEATYTDLTGAGPSQRLKADDRGYLAARIIRGEPEDRFPGALGFALPFAQAGPHAFVHYDRIERLLPSVPSSVTRIFGHALAHELGHALLETTEHSRSGLMRGRWGKADFQRTAVSFLEFSPAEAGVLQDNARRRAGKDAAGETKQKARIVIHLIDQVNVRLGVIGPAILGVSEIFERAGVDLLWKRQKPAGAEPAACELPPVAVFTVSVAPFATAGHTPNATAYANTRAASVAVFYDRVLAVADNIQPWRAMILMYVLAHEIAHLAQVVAQHAQTGIMKANWTVRDYYDMEQRSLQFTPADIRLIHAGLASRSCQPATDSNPRNARR